MKQKITEQEILDFQKKWAEGVIRIGKKFLEKLDYEKEAEKFLGELYAYDSGKVLFKPTLAADKQFRLSKQAALSYFIGGNPDFPEDKGFALKPWVNIRWENAGIIIIGNIAVAMGNYYFLPLGENNELKVEYTFVYEKDESGRLRIITHDSHLPYSR